jgi:hypothetical protein
MGTVGEKPPYLNQVFLVFVNRDKVAYNWRWAKADKSGAGLLEKHEERFERRAAQDPDNFLGVTDWEVFAHVSDTSSTFAPAGTATGDGSNHSSSASLALRMASSSVSPADAQPGSSGKKAAHRLVSGSCSTTNRSFIVKRIVSRIQARNRQMQTSRGRATEKTQNTRKANIQKQPARCL